MTLNKLSVPQLRSLLRFIGIPVTTRMRKPQLIELALSHSQLFRPMRPPPPGYYQSLRQTPRIWRFQWYFAAHPDDLSSRVALERALAQEQRLTLPQPPTRLALMKRKPQLNPSPSHKPCSQPRSSPLTQLINRHCKWLSRLHSKYR